MYEAFAYNYGWTREYVQKGLTRPLLKMYWYYMQKRRVRDLENQARMMWGYDPKEKQKGSGKKMAEKGQEDPLYGFPEDIDYLTPPQVRSKLSVSKRFGDRILPEARWDGERAVACFGKAGVVARRCSMNDKLWQIYQKSKIKGVSLSLNDIKKMILIDIKRSKLYPQGWKDANVDPPQWYIDKLQKEGMLEKILKDVDEATRS